MIAECSMCGEDYEEDDKYLLTSDEDIDDEFICPDCCAMIMDFIIKRN